jgi:hypothetical protein
MIYVKFHAQSNILDHRAMFSHEYEYYKVYMVNAGGIEIGPRVYRITVSGFLFFLFLLKLCPILILREGLCRTI